MVGTFSSSINQQTSIDFSVPLNQNLYSENTEDFLANPMLPSHMQQTKLHDLYVECALYIRGLPIGSPIKTSYKYQNKNTKGYVTCSVIF